MKLSGGERQKLSVVLALIGNPEIVFLDELTTGLDVAAKREVWKTLKELKSRGMTIFLTTHYMEEAENLCDRICLIKNGCKITEGPVSEVVAASPHDNLEDAYLWYMGGGNVIKRFLTLYKIEQKLFFRSPDVFVFNLRMPVVTLLLIGFIAGNKTATGSDITFIQSAFASLTAAGIYCSAFMSIPIVMVDYRDKKILKHLYCSPASSARILAADTLCRTTKSLNVATTILYFPMLFLSGATIPYELFPRAFKSWQM